MPPAPERSKGIPLSSYDICLPGEDKSAAGPTELLLLPDDGICLPGDDKTAPAAKAHPKRAHDRHRGQGHSAPAAEAPRTIINVGGGTMILTGSGGNITITVETEGHPAQQPTAGGPAAEPPHELAMRPLPPYRIEPPDVLQIDLPTLVPLPPYRAAFYDVLTIHVSNALTDQPIDNYFRVEASGVVNLGPAYGSVRVKGMTLEQIKKAVEKKLDPVVREPEVSVQLAQVFGAQPISGQYWVGPDGTINLRKYGLFQVRGMTIPEAQAALEKHLSKYLVCAGVIRRGGWVQQQVVLHHYRRGGVGRQPAAVFHYRQRDGAGRDQPGQRPVAAFQHEDLDRPALRRRPQEGHDPAG